MRIGASLPERATNLFIEVAWRSPAAGDPISVVDPSTGHLFVATGNGPWNGRTNWGDSVIELTANASRPVQTYTPVNQAALNAGDVDLGSSSPVLIQCSTFSSAMPSVRAIAGGESHFCIYFQWNGELVS